MRVRFSRLLASCIFAASCVSLGQSISTDLSISKLLLQADLPSSEGRVSGVIQMDLFENKLERAGVRNLQLVQYAMDDDARLQDVNWDEMEATLRARGSVYDFTYKKKAGNWLFLTVTCSTTEEPTCEFKSDDDVLKNLLDQVGSPDRLAFFQITTPSGDHFGLGETSGIMFSPDKMEVLGDIPKESLSQVRRILGLRGVAQDYDRPGVEIYQGALVDCQSEHCKVYP